MNTAFAAALTVEVRKFAASRVVRTATVLIVAGIAVLTGSMTVAAEAGNERILAQLGEFADAQGWDRLTGVAAQITGAGSLLGFGVVLAWVVGREFAEGTVSGLFALPVSRATVMAAKLTAFVAWTAGVAVALVSVLAVTGLAAGNGTPDGEALAGLVRLLALASFSGLLAAPAAWAATLGRGLLPGIATSIGTVVVAQVMVVSGTGAWFPVAAPSLWAMRPGDVSAAQLALVLLVPLLAGLLAVRAWSRLQLDR
ncbi:ABC transporter permease [Streptomyces sp. WMMB 322]|uniref:ABC transporter permease n=1 Tax=Streptomyces sp. WMMB 322 TaxID=1286821 RepID=UPI0006E269B3|nr:ABC transporter permease [Streptomyces sp. WMMB 322]